jgi:hypothetical protein
VSLIVDEYKYINLQQKKQQTKTWLTPVIVKKIKEEFLKVLFSFLKKEMNKIWNSKVCLKNDVKPWIR